VFDERRWLGFLEAFLAAGNGGGLDGVDDGGALRWNLDVSLVAAEEDGQ
jgi:hypothetical protein